MSEYQSNISREQFELFRACLVSFEHEAKKG